MRAPTVVLALLLGLVVAVPPAAAAPAGKYAGETSQERPLRLTVARGGRLVSALTFRFDAACRQAGVVHRGSSRVTNVPLSATGAFRTSGGYRTPVGDGLEARVRETVKGSVRDDGTAAGSLSVRSVIYDGETVVHRCSAPGVRWSARRR